MKTSLTLLITFTFALLLLCTIRTVEAVSKETKTLWISPVDDTYVDKSQPSVNFGSNTKLVVGVDTWTRFCFLKFDISSIPKGVHILSVELRLFCYDISTTSGAIIVGQESLLDEHGWDESTLTYALLEDIAESYGAHIGGFISGYETVDFSSISEWNQFSFNLTDSSFPSVLEESRGENAQQVTLHVNVWSGNGEITICSKEMGSDIMRPSLVVTYEKIPTTLSLQPITIDIPEGGKIQVYGTTSIEPSYGYLAKWLSTNYLEDIVITLEYEVSNSSGYRTTFERRVTTDSTGKFLDEFTPTTIGTYRIKASWDGSDIYTSSTSNEIQFSVLQNIDWEVRFDEARNLMYIFIVTTIAFVVSTIYLAIKKTRTKELPRVQ